MAIHFIDLSIFIIYLLLMLGIGFYFMKKNNSREDYYVGSAE
jgi:SSS family solute:Na+ symporter